MASSPQSIKSGPAQLLSLTSGNLRWAATALFVIGTAALLAFNWAGSSHDQAIATAPLEVLASHDRVLHKERRYEVATAGEDSQEDSEDGSEDSQDNKQHAPPGWHFANQKFTGVIHPRDVFLWYTKGEKTSSTVAATIIAHAYEEAGLAVVTHRGQLLGAAPGAYASLHHERYTDSRFKQLRDVVQRPVLLVVSIRDGSDWVMSQGFRAERLKRSTGERNVTSCSSIAENFRRATCDKYSHYIPPAESDTQAWWVIRHESVIEDTCAMLEKLGLTCPKEKAIGQYSRSDVEDKVDCPIPKKPEVVECINTLNEDVLGRQITVK